MREGLPRYCFVALAMSQEAITYSGWGMRRERNTSSSPIVLFLLLSLGAGLEELEVNFLMRDNILGSPRRVSMARAARSSLGTVLEK